MSKSSARLPAIDGVLIFESTWAGSMQQKAASVGIGALFWAVWLSMWLPLLTFGVWLLAPVYGASQVMANLSDSLPTLGLITIGGVALGVFLVLWGTVQWALRGPAPRLPDHPSVTMQGLAEHHAMDIEALREAWAHRRLVIHHRPSGSVEKIEASLPREDANIEAASEPPRLRLVA
jgi:poly-beta-1,6-N-acetyl-D-glucosamine biosynthesis protein PgaD